MDNPHIRAYFLAIVTTLLTVLTVYMLRPFLVTIGLAGVFAVIFTPLHKRLQRTKLPETLSALLTLLIGVLLVVVIVGFVGMQFFREAQSVYASVAKPGSITHAQDVFVSLGHSLDPTFPGASAYFTSLAVRLPVYVQSLSGWAFAHVGSVFSSALDLLLQSFVFLVTLYYLMREGPRLKNGLERFSPLTKTETDELVTRMSLTISSVLRGSLLVSVILGAFTAFGFFIFGISNSILWGTIAIIASLVPSIGAGLVFVPAVLYLFFIGHTGTAIGLAIYAAIGVSAIDYGLRPYLVGGSARIHPLLVLLSVLGGLVFFGPGGLFLGPLVMSLLLGLLSIYTPSRVRTPSKRQTQ